MTFINDSILKTFGISALCRTTRISEMFGRFLIWIKWKQQDFQIYFIHNRT